MMGAFDDLKWTYDGAFKHLFELGLNGELEQINAYLHVGRECCTLIWLRH